MACRYFEPQDVTRGIGVAFDSEGKKLNVRVLESSIPPQSRTILIEETSESPAPNELKEILVTFMSHPKLPAKVVEDAATLRALSLAELVSRAFRFECK